MKTIMVKRLLLKCSAVAVYALLLPEWGCTSIRLLRFSEYEHTAVVESTNTEPALFNVSIDLQYTSK